MDNKEEIAEVEIIDLDKVEEDFEEDDSEWEWEHTADGINIYTGEYNPMYDAHYPDFKILAQVERELFGKRSH